jgi:hypothetical protein
MDEISVKTDRKWYEIWWDIWTHPGSATFEALLNERNITTGRAFTWVAVTAFVAYLVAALVSIMMMNNLFPRVETTFTWMWICYVVVAPVGAILGAAIWAGIYHWVAKLLGGTGAWDRLLFCYSAIQAPLLLVGVLLSLVMVPIMRSAMTTMIATQSLFLVYCLLMVVSLGLGIYNIVLNVSAIKAVERLDTGKAVLAFFLPPIVIIVLLFCGSMAFAMLFRGT